MAAVQTRDILLRVGGRTLHRTGVLACAGAGRDFVEVAETVTRADATTCATYIDRDGILRLAAANKVRIEYPPGLSGLVDQFGYPYCGPSLEGSRTNGWDRSEEVDHANWTKFNATVTPNIAIFAPDGTTNSDFLVEDGTNNNHEFGRTTPTLTDNTRSVVSVFVRASSRFWFRIATTDKANVSRSTWFNASTGVVGTKNAGHDVFIAQANLSSGAYFRRYAVSFDSAAGATAPRVDFLMATADGGGAYVGDGVSGMVFWGMMIEVDKAFPGSYIKTTTAAVTRAADSLTGPGNFGPLPEMTVLARIARPVHADASGSLGVDSPRIYAVGSPQPLLHAFFNNTARELYSQIDTAGTDGSTPAAAIPAGATLSYLTQYRNLGTTGGQMAHDTGSGLSSFSAAASAFAAFGNQTLYVGRVGFGGNELYGVLLDLIIARGLFSLTEMLAIP